MNNLLPLSVRLHEKYDLKGSSYKRRASKREKAKHSPTLKDLDFLANHPEGIYLEADTYSALINTMQRDCRVRLHELYICMLLVTTSQLKSDVGIVFGVKISVCVCVLSCLKIEHDQKFGLDCILYEI